jgi:hypothetical protein
VSPVAAKPTAVSPVAAKPAAVSPVAAKPGAVSPIAAKPVAVSPAVKPTAVGPVAAKPAAPHATPASAVSSTPSAVVPVRTAVKAVPVQAVPPLDERVTYQYNALGRRDPFQAMVGGTFVGDDVGGDAPMDVGGIKVVGIVWGASDKFALIEDSRGNSAVLRTGDKVMNGVVETLKRDAVVVKLTVDGQTETVAIPLTRKGDQTNANR